MADCCWIHEFWIRLYRSQRIEADGSYWANRFWEVKLVCVFTYIFANSKSTGHDFKASSVLLPDASNAKFLFFLAVRLTHATCPAHSIYSTVTLEG